MKIILEHEDYTKAVTPFRNGCSFRLTVSPEGFAYLGYGCYCLYLLLTGAEEQFYRKIEANGGKPIKLDIPWETKEAMIKAGNCRICGGTKQ